VETTGKRAPAWSALWRSATGFLTPVPGVELFSIASGGLRYTPTTGYFLTAFQADKTVAPMALRRGHATLPNLQIG